MTSVKEEELNLEQCQTDERYGLGLVVGGGLINYKSLDSISELMGNQRRGRRRLGFTIQSATGPDLPFVFSLVGRRFQIPITRDQEE